MIHLIKCVNLSLLACSLAVVTLAGTGCSTPPSVEPLLSVSQRVMLAEAQRVEADTQRDEQRVRQSLSALEAAFAADLEQRDGLDPAWLMSAVSGYTAARESLVEHRIQLQRERQTRARNLRQAAALTDRAVGMLQRRDALVDRVLPQLDPAIWRWLVPEPGEPSADNQ